VKDYLSKDERVDFLFLKKYLDSNQRILENWNNNLTKEEKKALKITLTWRMKVFESVINRMNDTAIGTLKRSLEQSNLIIEDRFSMQMYQKKFTSDLMAAYEMNKDYYNLVTLMLENNCKDCKKKCTECKIYVKLESKNIPEPMPSLPNCRYAYTLEQTEEDKKRVARFLNKTENSFRIREAKMKIDKRKRA